MTPPHAHLHAAYRRRRQLAFAGLAGALASGTMRASAQDADAEAQHVAEAASGPSLEVTWQGWVELSYTHALHEPESGVIALRGFNNRHATFLFENAVLAATLRYDRLSVRIAAQLGNTPATYYLAEPLRAAVGGVGASGVFPWQLAQELYASWRLPIEGVDLTLEGGLFLSPIGIEAMAVRDNATWSRSNLFVGLPFYHSGVRARWQVDPSWALSLALWNGWNSVLDNNQDKSVSLALDGSVGSLRLHALTFAGIERDSSYAGGRPLRLMLDMWAALDVLTNFTVSLHGNAGFESTSFGVNSWTAAAVTLRWDPIEVLRLAARADLFREDASVDAEGVSQRIFWPTDLLASATFTLTVRPEEHVAATLELRHDRAATAVFYRGSDAEGAPSALEQTSLTLGVTAGF